MYLVALDALGSELVFVAFCTIDVVLLWDKGFRPDWVVACATDKTFFMPLPRLVLHFLHA